MPDQSRLPALPAAARDAILAWYGQRGRPLAFRRTTDPYAVLVSESMAQQTQAARAAAHWERFMVRFPTIEALAAASPADVLRQWAGLGYDRRALALWKTARIAVERHAGRLPADIEGLEALPGIGPYTARAVAALAFGLPVGAVDVNVRRVLGRIVVGDASGVPARMMQELADAAVPLDQPGSWTHALMDIGATVCRTRAPRCPECPAQAWCRFAANARAAVAATSSGAGRAQMARHPRAVREVAPAFESTNRWLRGRILDRARAAPDDEWQELTAPIGGHDGPALRTAARVMARDGVLEVDGEDEAGALRIRLPLS